MKRILITGAAGGLGGAAAEYFASRGYHVYGLDIKEKENTETITYIKTDICSETELMNAYSYISAEGELDAIIDLAGIYIMDAYSEVSEDDIRKIVEINLLAVWRVNKLFLPLLKKNGRVIVVTSELDGQKALPFTGMYAMTKSALGSYTDSLRTELALLGYKVIKIRPGAFATELYGDSFRSMERLKGKTVLFSDFFGRFEKLMHSLGGKTHSPSLLAARLFKIAECRNPRASYTIKAGFLLWLYDKIPYCIGTKAVKMLLSK